MAGRIVVPKLRLVCLLLSFAIVPAFQATAQERIVLDIRGVVERPAFYYSGDNALAVVLAHQSGLDAGSWRPLAERLLNEGISSVALTSTSSDDVLAAADFLDSKGHENITLIGASIGGGAVLHAMSRQDPVSVKGVILLAPADGHALQSETRRKLFVVAMEDFFAGRTYSGFDKAAEPKVLLEYPGAEHGQELLDGPHGENLIGAILKFIKG
ncbi:MAG: hypothetical protein GY789_25815 [Hyphomicrobiales bacterium]|nr:hypothetical protein [Hyphomicrobiales bacterium]MCP4997556.1 hypothetical protein [Hyphomicrobiales bacterium]